MEGIMLFVKHLNVDDLHSRGVGKRGKSPSQNGSGETSNQQLPKYWEMCWDSAGPAACVHIGAQEI